MFQNWSITTPASELYVKNIQIVYFYSPLKNSWQLANEAQLLL